MQSNRPVLSLALSAFALITCAGSASAQYEWQTTVNLARLHQFSVGAGIEIGQIETGTPRLNHVALDAGVANSKVRFVRSSAGQNTNSDHATHVAGLIAGRAGSDGAGFTGAAPGARLQSSNWIDPAGAPAWEDNFLGAMTDFFLVAPRPSLINMSAGSLPTDTAAERLRVQYSADWVATKGILFVAAAGNEGVNGMRSPGTGFNVLTVGATGQTGALKNYNRIADYSARGPATVGGGSRMKPDLVAPGSRIYSPRQDALGGNFKRFSDQMDVGGNTSGTSFATPIVSGVAGCLYSFGAAQGLNTDPRVMRAVLMNSTSKSVEDSAGTRWDRIAGLGKGAASMSSELGTGQLDAGQALDQFRGGQTHVNPVGAGLVPQLGFDMSTTSALGVGPSYVTNQPVRKGSYMTSTICWNRPVTTGYVEDVSSPNYGTNNWANWSYGTLTNLDIKIAKAGDATILQQSNATDGTSEHSVFKAPGRELYATRIDTPAVPAATTDFGIAWEWTAAPGFTKQYNGSFGGNSHGNYLDDGWFRAGIANPPAPTISKPTFVPDNNAAWALRVSSSVEAAQEAFNPLDSFTIDFDYGYSAGASGTMFYAMLGSLNLFELSGVAGGMVTPDATNTNQYKHFSLTLNRGALAALTDQFVDLKFGAIGGPDNVWIDNVTYVPSPGAIGLGLAGLLLAAGRRR